MFPATAVQTAWKRRKPHRMRNKWLPLKQPSQDTELRIFAFPYAGGGASSLRRLSQQMPASIDLCPVQLPGREGRIAEDPVTELAELGEMLVVALGEYLHLPYALLGYSMGAIVALEFASSISEHKLPPPKHFLACARGGPGIRPRWSGTEKPSDQELIARLRELGGTTAEVIDNTELLEIILPILRADYALNSSYTLRDFKLECPVTVMGGLDDLAVSRDCLRNWSVVSTMPCREKMLRGGHFFIQERPAEFAAAIANAVSYCWSSAMDMAEIH